MAKTKELLFDPSSTIIPSHFRCWDLFGAGCDIKYVSCLCDVTSGDCCDRILWSVRFRDPVTNPELDSYHRTNDHHRVLGDRG